ncbi:MULTISPECIES: hypothetical protein [Planomonospora]|nr:MULTISPECIES: hypothetical protein [Planomonospora]
MTTRPADVDRLVTATGTGAIKAVARATARSIRRTVPRPHSG